MDMNQSIAKMAQYKAHDEREIIASVYSDAEILYTSNLKAEEMDTPKWKLLLQVALELVYKEHRTVLDSMTISNWMDKHAKARELYEKNGGFGAVLEAMNASNANNYEASLADLRKWNALIKLVRAGFPYLEKYTDMTAEEIYDEYEVMLNHTFADIDSDVKSYDICAGIHDLIEELDEGTAVGLPFADMPLLTAETGGMHTGNITLLGGISNAGKSTIARSAVIPSIMKHNEKVVIMINEDSVSKWQREMLVWVLNNVFKVDTKKSAVRDGNYTPHLKKSLHIAASWLEEHTKNHSVTLIPFVSYKTEKAIKEIRKYAAMGVKYFVLDTFKMDAGKVSAQSWLEMQQSMVDIKNSVKSDGGADVHILITFQLEKGSSNLRYYTQDRIGISKNIVDVASTCIMVRDLLPDEYYGGSRELKVSSRASGQKEEVLMDPSKKYQLLFIVKNQEGAANNYQIVIEHDKSRNTIKEVGITVLSPDF